jgi:glutamate-ammonia-ligase adenylyltransferase
MSSPEISLAVQRAAERLEALGGPAFAEAVRAELLASADEERASTNLLRWIDNTPGAEARADLLHSDPGFAHRLITLMGASQVIADVIHQNPEMALILGDQGELGQPITANALNDEAQRLLAPAKTYQHRLDRLRYLKQRALVRIVWNDLSAEWQPPKVWLALSDLADVTIRCALRLAAEHVGADAQDMAVLAMGKLGSRELNYSSDIDLILLAKESAASTELLERVGEALAAALMGKMGRGFLYRVDYRLRPFGGAGPIIQRLPAAVAYYQRYAEPWEMQALVRCRPCAGSLELGERFLEAVRPEVYRPTRSELFLDSLLQMKLRYEEEIRRKGEEEQNLKQGPGGIRDIEFLVQVMQLMEGYRKPELHGAATLDAVDMLADTGLLTRGEAEVLSSGYLLMRQAEHRIQLRFNVQSHDLPKKPEERAAFARLLGMRSWEEAERTLRRRRKQVRAVLEHHIPLTRTPPTADALCEEFGYPPDSEAALSLRKLISFHESGEEVVRTIRADAASTERLRLIIERAPRMLPDIAFHTELWDVAFSEEIEMTDEELQHVRERLTERLTDETIDWERAITLWLRHLLTSIALRHAKHGASRRTAVALTEVAQTALILALDEVGAGDVDVLSFGRLGSRELLLPSDWDVSFVALDGERLAAAEHAVEECLRLFRRLHASGVRIPLDTRLRPEGSAGPLVRSLTAFQRYAETSMESWERLAFTRARSLRGIPEVDALARAAASYGDLRPETRRELLEMKARVQRERVPEEASGRDIKLGKGGSIEVEWIASLLELQHGAVESTGIPEKLDRLSERGILAADDKSALVSAYWFFADLRNAMYLLDLPSTTLLPERGSRGERLLAQFFNATPESLAARVRAAQDDVLRSWKELSA